VKVFLMITVSAAIMAWLVLNNSESSEAEISFTVPEQASELSSYHFTVQDLASSGCFVPVESVKKQYVDTLVGTTDAYAVKSSEGCRVLMMSMVQDSAAYDESLWAGTRAEAAASAERQGLSISSHAGRLGIYSEVITFAKNGEYQGFEYIIQWQGAMQNILLMNSTLRPDEKFEAIMRSHQTGIVSVD